jgi:hypothetical protein
MHLMDITYGSVKTRTRCAPHYFCGPQVKPQRVQLAIYEFATDRVHFYACRSYLRAHARVPAPVIEWLPRLSAFALGHSAIDPSTHHDLQREIRGSHHARFSEW